MIPSCLLENQWFKNVMRSFIVYSPIPTQHYLQPWPDHEPGANEQHRAIASPIIIVKIVNPKAKYTFVNK